MASLDRLSARIDEERAETIEEIADERDVPRSEVEREAVETGLANLGYIDEPAQPHRRLLWHVRRVGLLLGFVGLTALGYGVFGPRVASLVGFGVTMGAFLLVAVAEGLDTYVGGEGA